MTDMKQAGYRCEVHMPDGTVLVRKHATTAYRFALCRKQMLPGVITERWGWKLLGMSATAHGANSLVKSRGPLGCIDAVFPVIAIPRMVKARKRNPGFTSSATIERLIREKQFHDAEQKIVDARQND